MYVMCVLCKPIFRSSWGNVLSLAPLRSRPKWTLNLMLCERGGGCEGEGGWCCCCCLGRC